MGTTTIGGSQHTAGVRLLRKAGLNPDKDLTVVLGGDVPTQLQALVNGSIQVGILSPPTVIVARDKYKMNILGSAMDEFTSIQNGLAVLDKVSRTNETWSSESFGHVPRPIDISTRTSAVLARFWRSF